MYFQKLATMSRYQIDPFLINSIDLWLATRRQAVKKHLSPLQFSNDFGIDQEVSTRLFAICAIADIKLLRARYVVECPCCKRIILSTFNSSEISAAIFCEDCNEQFRINKDDVVLWFELLQDPDSKPMDDLFLKHGGTVGKELGLRPSMVENSTDHYVRGLFSTIVYEM